MIRITLIATVLTLLTAIHHAHAQGTAFTYQGTLKDGGNPVNGDYDLEFTLQSAPTGSSQVGNLFSTNNVPVSNGVFTVTLDFGAAPFTGEPRWLEIGVLLSGSLGPSSVLVPRQKVTASPYAITAGNVTGVLPAGSLSGTYSNGLILNNPANQFSGTFSGNGTGVTNVMLENIYTEGAIVPRKLGMFTLVSTLTVGGNPTNVQAADVNLDGSLDIISANSGNHTISVLTNDGAGNFALATTLAPAGLNVRMLSVADVNGDGSPDIVVDRFSPARLAVFTNDGSGGFVSLPQPALLVGFFPNDMATGLVNADGSIDVLITPAISPPAYLFTNNGAGVFALHSRPIDSTAFFIDLADVTGDGRPDIVGESKVWTNNGSGAFIQSSTLNSGLSSEQSRPRFADVNNDGRPDVIITSRNENALSVLTNAGGDRFTLMTTNAVPGAPFGHAAADVNNDGYLDIITANTTGNSVTVLTNNRGGGFAIASTTPVGNGPSRLAAGDWNGDGQVDLVVANYVDGTLSVLFGNNSYTFTGTFIGLGIGLSALNASSLTMGTVPGDRLAGTYPNAVTFNNPANSFSGAFAGNGAGLTNLSANAISGGLTTNIAILVPGPKTNTLFFTNGVLRAIQ